MELLLFVNLIVTVRHIQKQHPNENETPQQDGNDDLIIDDFEMIPT